MKMQFPSLETDMFKCVNTVESNIYYWSQDYNSLFPLDDTQPSKLMRLLSSNEDEPAALSSPGQSINVWVLIHGWIIKPVAFPSNVCQSEPGIMQIPGSFQKQTDFLRPCYQQVASWKPFYQNQKSINKLSFIKCLYNNYLLSVFPVGRFWLEHCRLTWGFCCIPFWTKTRVWEQEFIFLLML